MDPACVPQRAPGPALLRDIGRRVLRALPLDDIMIIRIGHGGVLLQDVRVQHLAQEHGMGGGLHLVDHLADDIGTGIRHHRQEALHRVVHLVELIVVPAALEAEGADDAGLGILPQDGDGELPGVLDALVGVVVMVDAYGDGGGFRCDLHGAVGRAARGPALVPCADYVYAVG